MKLETKIKRTLKDADMLILACKAKGGYKFRQRFQCTDLELEKILAGAEKRIRTMAVSLAVAEAMLQEPPPSFHPRWEEYIRRRADMVAEMVKK
jgi:hypothetical protein